MNTRRAIISCLLLLLWSCQPSPRCDPGQYEMGGGCYPVVEDSGPGDDEDAGSDADGGQDASMGNECPGGAYEGFGETCTASSQCSCHAPVCAMSPLQYCTKVNCAASDPESCPPQWTCLTIPPGASPDPSIKTLCLKP